MACKKWLAALVAATLSVGNMGIIASADDFDLFSEDAESGGASFGISGSLASDGAGSSFSFGDMSFSDDVKDWLGSVSFDYDTFSSYSFSMPEMNLSSQDLSDRYNSLMSDLVIEGYGTKFEDINMELPQYSLDVSSLYASCWGEGLASNYQQFTSFEDVWGSSLDVSYKDICAQAQSNRDAIFKSAQSSFSSSDCFATFYNVQTASDTVVADFLSSHQLASYSQLMNNDALKSAQSEIDSKVTNSYNTNLEDLQNSMPDYSAQFNERLESMHQTYTDTIKLADAVGTDAFNDPTVLDNIDGEFSDEVVELVNKYGSAEEAFINLSDKEKYTASYPTSGFQYAGAYVQQQWEEEHYTDTAKQLKTLIDAGLGSTTSKQEFEQKEKENSDKFQGGSSDTGDSIERGNVAAMVDRQYIGGGKVTVIPQTNGLKSSHNLGNLQRLKTSP